MKVSTIIGFQNDNAAFAITEVELLLREVVGNDVEIKSEIISEQEAQKEDDGFDDVYFVVNSDFSIPDEGSSEVLRKITEISGFEEGMYCRLFRKESCTRTALADERARDLVSMNIMKTAEQSKDFLDKNPLVAATISTIREEFDYESPDAWEAFKSFAAHDPNRPETFESWDLREYLWLQRDLYIAETKIAALKDGPDKDTKEEKATISPTIKVKGLRAYASSDPNYPGINLDIEDENGALIPLATAEIVDGKLSLYAYMDLSSEEFTNKLTSSVTEDGYLPAEKEE